MQLVLRLDDADPVGDAPFGSRFSGTLLEMIDIAPGRHQVRRDCGLAGKQVVGLAPGIVALQVAKMIENDVLGRFESQRRGVGPGDEIVRNADIGAVILDRIIPIATARQFVVEAIDSAGLAHHHLADLVAVNELAQLLFKFGINRHRFVL